MDLGSSLALPGCLSCHHRRLHRLYAHIPGLRNRCSQFLRCLLHRPLFLLLSANLQFCRLGAPGSSLSYSFSGDTGHLFRYFCSKRFCSYGNLHLQSANFLNPGALQHRPVRDRYARHRWCRGQAGRVALYCQGSLGCRRGFACCLLGVAELSWFSSGMLVMRKGKLVKVQRVARIGRNPGRGEVIQIKGQDVRGVPPGQGREGSVVPRKRIDRMRVSFSFPAAYATSDKLRSVVSAPFLVQVDLIRGLRRSSWRLMKTLLPDMPVYGGSLYCTRSTLRIPTLI